MSTEPRRSHAAQQQLLDGALARLADAEEAAVATTAELARNRATLERVHANTQAVSAEADAARRVTRSMQKRSGWRAWLPW
jgi:hypothetical protein